MDYKGFINTVESSWDKKDQYNLITGADVAIPRVHSEISSSRNFFGNHKPRKALPSFSLDQLAILPTEHDIHKCGYIITELNGAYGFFSDKFIKLDNNKIAQDIREKGLRLSEDAISVAGELNHFDMEFLKEWLPEPIYKGLHAVVVLADKIMGNYHSERYLSSKPMY